MSEDADLLFVYGTLMRAYDHPMARLLAARADYVGEAQCNGILYLVKHYPGLVLSNDPAEIVHGEVFRMRRPHELLAELDRYEACGEGFAAPTEYVRQIVQVTLADMSLVDASLSEMSTADMGVDDSNGATRTVNARTIKAWTYVYNWPVTKLPRIAGGRFGI